MLPSPVEKSLLAAWVAIRRALGSPCVTYGGRLISAVVDETGGQFERSAPNHSARLGIIVEVLESEIAGEDEAPAAGQYLTLRDGRRLRIQSAERRGLFWRFICQPGGAR